MDDVTPREWQGSYGDGVAILLLHSSRIEQVGSVIGRDVAVSPDRDSFSQARTPSRQGVRAYGYFYDPESIKLFVVNVSHSTTREIAESTDAYSVRWVPREIMRFGKMKKHKCRQDCRESHRCVTPGCLCDEKSGRCI